VKFKRWFKDWLEAILAARFGVVVCCLTEVIGTLIHRPFVAIDVASVDISVVAVGGFPNDGEGSEEKETK
jgi:hypothetical protein